MIYVVFLRISQKLNPLRLHSAPQIQIESSYFYKRVCGGVSLALEVFGVDTSAGRVGRTGWSFPVLWGWREWFFWQREDTLERNATISISLCVTVLMIWVMEMDHKYLFPTYMDEVVRINMKIGEMVTQKQFDHNHLIWEYKYTGCYGSCCVCNHNIKSFLRIVIIYINLSNWISLQLIQQKYLHELKFKHGIK